MWTGGAMDLLIEVQHALFPEPQHPTPSQHTPSFLANSYWASRL